MAHILKEDAEFLAHYGVKGMKWGVRKTPVWGKGNEFVDGMSRRNASRVNNLKAPARAVKSLKDKRAAGAPARAAKQDKVFAARKKIAESQIERKQLKSGRSVYESARKKHLGTGIKSNLKTAKQTANGREWTTKLLTGGAAAGLALNVGAMVASSYSKNSKIPWAAIEKGANYATYALAGGAIVSHYLAEAKEKKYFTDRFED